jgi:hypothetical protein
VAHADPERPVQLKLGCDDRERTAAPTTEYSKHADLLWPLGATLVRIGRGEGGYGRSSGSGGWVVVLSRRSTGEGWSRVQRKNNGPYYLILKARRPLIAFWGDVGEDQDEEPEDAEGVAAAEDGLLFLFEYDADTLRIV